MFSDPQFWILVAFIIFVASVFNPVRKILLNSLDKKIEEIKNNIDEAEKIRNESQITLSEIKKRQNKVKIEIENINLDSKEKLELIEKNILLKLDEQKNKHKSLFDTKIEQKTREANIEIQDYITKTAIKAALKIIEKKLDDKEKQNLIDNSVAELDLIFKN